jgi:hypothetical protein
VKVKGLFVRGSQIDDIVKQFPEIVRYQAVVTRAGHQDHRRLGCKAQRQWK